MVKTKYRGVVIDMTNREKDAQLGMPYGTAVGRLRKKVLFSLLQKYKEDTCCKCHKIIETEEELSLEHKIPWLYNSNDLFWDLDNIGFSHKTVCNKPDRPYRKGPLLRNYPQGMMWCNIHKRLLPEDRFWRDSSRRRGYQQRCIECSHLDRK
jgi:hypothetical protein